MSSSGLPTEPVDTATAGTTASGPLVLDRYRLTRRLGAGAYGTVWMAFDEHLERDVAVKILARQLIADGRFEREARAAARLSHPAIVTLYEATVDDEGAYLVSEPVRGATLDALLADGRLSDRDIVAIGIALCDALEHAHGEGVVHRDVKPSNVLVPDKPGRGRHAQPAKLTDFGVARVIDHDSLTLTGDVIGTLAYMAPEQAAGLEANEPADLYALALVLYEALTGVNPVRPRGHGSRQARPVALPPLRRQRRDLPAELGAAIDRALALHVDDRGSVADLRDGLVGVLEVVSDEPGIVADPWSPQRDHEAGTEPLVSPRWPRRPGGDDGAAGRDVRDGRTVAQRRGSAEPRRGLARLGPRATGEADPSRLLWQRRALAGAGAAAWTGWLAHQLLRPSPLPIAALALGAAAATLALPRLGWLAAATFLCVAVAIQGHAGAALVIALAAALPMLTMPSTGWAWPLAAGAPALGLVGVAGAWPALAGWSGTPWRRAWLAVVGWLWLLLAGAVAGPRGRTLYLHVPAGIPRRTGHHGWERSPAAAIHHLLVAYVHAGVLPAAAVWALAALLAPYLVHRRVLGLDLVRVTLWAAATAVAVTVSVTLVHHSDQASSAPSALLGAVAAAILVLIGAYVSDRVPGGWAGGAARTGGEAP